MKAAEVVRLANQAESAKRKAERARQEESELQVCYAMLFMLHGRCYVISWCSASD